MSTAAFIFVAADDSPAHLCSLGVAADFSRGGESLQGLTGAPLWASSALFASALGGLCYFSSTRVLDIVNGVLFGGVLVSFGVRGIPTMQSQTRAANPDNRTQNPKQNPCCSVVLIRP